MYQLESFSDQNEQNNFAPRRVMHGLFIDCLKINTRSLHIKLAQIFS